MISFKKFNPKKAQKTTLKKPILRFWKGNGFFLVLGYPPPPDYVSI